MRRFIEVGSRSLSGAAVPPGLWRLAQPFRDPHPASLDRLRAEEKAEVPARFRCHSDVLFGRADAVCGRKQLVGSDQLVVAGAEQKDRLVQVCKIDPPAERDELALSEPIFNGAPRSGFGPATTDNGATCSVNSRRSVS
jgi:hypothetical protein